jgi:hypothetical protein
MDRSRRTVLATLAVGSLGFALAGCTDADSPAETETARREPTSPTATLPSSTDADETATPSTADLDLREANVVGVSVDPRDGGIQFSVTLHHDDAGEPGYANWWQVEDLDGTRLGRRDLLHAHDRQPFTRSETVGIPEGVTCVLVRGHDETHGYGGQVVAVDLETGRTRPIDQGSDPQSIDASVCPS